MSTQNSSQHYGSVAKSFHWLTALLILSLFPIGFYATSQAEALTAGDSSIDIARVTFMFSLHKTLGLSLFFIALLRILWALVQPKPKLLHGDRNFEAWIAETVHWMLYGALFLLPLTGWIHHAASTGFAPIWGPFGQTLPFVPQDEMISSLFSGLHGILQWILLGSIGLHIAGALKHHIIDKDDTLRRMLPGAAMALPSEQQPSHYASVLTAALLWSAILGGGVWAGIPDRTSAPQPILSQSSGEWTVSQGTLGLSVTQLGNTVSGSFDNWSAQIQYSETAPDPQKGHVEVEISVPSLVLGSVAGQALGPDYFFADSFPVALFQADLVASNGQLLAQGSLKIKETTVPLSFPVTLLIEGDTAQASGTFSLDRRDFAIGDQVPDAKTLGFSVEVAFDLIAQR